MRPGGTASRRFPSWTTWRSRPPGNGPSNPAASMAGLWRRWWPCRSFSRLDEDFDMFDRMRPQLQSELAKIREGGLWKDERVLASAQGPEVTLADGHQVLVLCANNY